MFGLIEDFRKDLLIKRFEKESKSFWFAKFFVTPDFKHSAVRWPMFNKLGRGKFNEIVRRGTSDEEFEADVLHFCEMVGPEDFGSELMSAAGEREAVNLYYQGSMIPLEEALDGRG